MWSLAEARERLGRRLAEASTAFWDDTERNNAINEGQRFISAVTRQVRESVTGEVSVASPYLTFTRELVGASSTAGMAGSRRLTGTPIEMADMLQPAWRDQIGAPRHLVIDFEENRAYLTPAPTVPMEASVRAAVLASELANDSQRLFDNLPHMAKYQDALTNYAASVCLLRERYDNDAERFYNLALASLRHLGAPGLPRPEVSGGLDA